MSALTIIKEYLDDTEFRDHRIKHQLKVRDMRIQRLEDMLQHIREKSNIGYVEDLVRQGLADEYDDEIFDRFGWEEYPEEEHNE